MMKNIIKRNLVKTITWRIIIFLFSWIYFGKIKMAIEWNIATTIIYYIHENLWEIRR